MSECLDFSQTQSHLCFVWTKEASVFVMFVFPHIWYVTSVQWCCHDSYDPQHVNTTYDFGSFSPEHPASQREVASQRPSPHDRRRRPYRPMSSGDAPDRLLRCMDARVHVRERDGENVMANSLLLRCCRCLAVCLCNLCLVLFLCCCFSCLLYGGLWSVLCRGDRVADLMALHWDAGSCKPERG